MTGLFENLTTVSNALQSVQQGTFSTCTPDDKDLVSHEHVNCSLFPIVTICLHETSKHYIGDNVLTPPQLVLWPPTWKKENLRVVLIGDTIGRKDTKCGPYEFAVLFKVRQLCIFKEKILLSTFEL